MKTYNFKDVSLHEKLDGTCYITGAIARQKGQRRICFMFDRQKGLRFIGYNKDASQILQDLKKKIENL